ncbi:HD-GYP domain-containing protein [Duganella sp. OV458]|uniref:HD-GYP domain-containing protein n=2 Tax=unclassified Duganella TaxID=2636909 RepID=UPI0008867040|nr:HD domain-containing phosphohydrolase [Duganella sp. OV458]SDG55218.1 HD-GYP domain, c-di-GMP phosphodiesterase class II (or its inactivated variant) [Duganella sp. OV458]SDJ77920.1 HD-GYP domain, c-di-GMP phosphodiesterase class II (or its inactivated variant) [Duganella sp. OV510]
MSDTNPNNESSSALHQLNLCNRRLERLLHNLRNEHNAEGEMRDIAADVIRAVEINPDVALACIFLGQINGTYAVRHCIETAVVTVVIARSMQMSAASTLTVTAAALTMNVGMLRHHEGFQNKNAPLSKEEMAIVRRHPEESADMLRCVGVDDDDWISCVLMHHENDEGSGYPSGIASPEVTLNAKLLSFADRYCAQVSARNYRKSILPSLALRNLVEDKAAPVDPHLADCFKRELGDFPPGCLVRLDGGEIGVVSRRQGCSNGLQVHYLRDAAGAMMTPAQPRCCNTGLGGISEGLSEDEAATRFSMKQIWGAQASL